MLRPGAARTGGLLLVAAVALVWWLPARRQAPSSPAATIHALLQDAEAARLFEPQLADAPPHRPFARGVSNDVRPSDMARWTMASRLEKQAEALPTGSGHAAAASGLSMLYAGETAAAIDLFREAVHLEPRESSYWNDLAAASLIRARPTDLLQALDAAETAVQLVPTSAAAAFNRALAMENLGLSNAARDAWTGFAAQATETGWREEATAHLAALPVPSTPVTADDVLKASEEHRAAIARRDLDRLRVLLEEELMPRIGVVCDGGDARACADLLQGTRGIALAGAKASPDAMWTAVAAQVERWGSSGPRPEDRAALTAYGEAVRLFNRDQVAQSAEIFSRLAMLTGDSPATVRWNAQHYTCIDAYFRAAHAAARACLDRLDDEMARRRFIFMRGKVEWIRSQISLVEGNLARASGDFDRAVQFMRDAQAHQQAAVMASLRATLLDQLGAFHEAWQDRLRALALARLEPRRRHTLYTSAARSCLLQQFPRAALHFQRAAVANASEWGQPGGLVEAHLNMGVVLQRLGDAPAARQSLAAARTHFAAVTDPRARVRFGSELAVMEGEVLAEAAPADALRALDQANATLTAMQFDLMRVRVEYASGLAAERLGRFPDALAAYERGVAIIERQREPLAASAQMQSIDLAWDMYDRLIARQLEDSGPAAAFQVAESARAQVLRRFLPDAAAPPPPLAALPGLLEARTVVVYFVVLDRETLRWTVSSTAGVQFARLPIGRQQLEYLTRRVRRALDQPSWRAPLEAASAPLAEVIWSRGSPLSAGTTMLVIPDGALHELPFGALIDPATGRHLVEDHPVVVAPSLRLFLAASRSARERFRSLDRALVVEGRTGASEGQEPLPPLPAAKAEIKFVAGAYAGSRVLAGADATPQRFLAEAGEFPIVHFTGHAVADRLSPDLSRLFLAPSAADPTGWLLLRDLESGSFPRTGLVVLGACETGAGRVLRGEGAISLARPFLGKGAAGVVYSLWRVGDVASLRILTVLHEGIRGGLEPAIALQQAQRRMIADGQAGDVRTWAAFQYAGGLRATPEEARTGANQ